MIPLCMLWVVLYGRHTFFAKILRSRLWDDWWLDWFNLLFSWLLKLILPFCRVLGRLSHPEHMNVFHICRKYDLMRISHLEFFVLVSCHPTPLKITNITIPQSTQNEIFQICKESHLIRWITLHYFFHLIVEQICHNLLDFT